MENTFENLRQTAYKVWIADLLRADFVKSPGEFQPSYAIVKGANISRVNLMGVIINKNYQEGFASLMIDDSSGSIALRAWKENAGILDTFSVGELVLVVGKVRNFNNKIYVVPDFLRKLENADWLRFRKLELEKKHGKTEKAEPANEIIIPENISEEDDIGFTAVLEERVENVADSKESINKVQMLISLIDEEDKGEGADIDVVISRSKIEEKEAQSILDSLLRGGEIFQIKPGRIRSLL